MPAVFEFDGCRGGGGAAKHQVRFELFHLGRYINHHRIVSHYQLTMQLIDQLTISSDSYPSIN